VAYVLCLTEVSPSRPDWDRLFETAAAQEGLFTTKQAAEAGYSPQLLVHYVHIGRAVRVHRGIYRLVHFPAGEHEELVAAWLWSQQAGVVSHQSALALHGLSDVLLAHIHLTLPAAWRRRRFRVPVDVVLHHADVPSEDRAWFGAVPTTSPRWSLNDCAREGFSPELLRQAAQQALRRGLVTKTELGDVEAALAPFGGLAAGRFARIQPRRDHPFGLVAPPDSADPTPRSGERP
jgi:predicted transcriptional regulator of viral defense system